jgi:DNA-binding HxlR family transcriptional regulator
MKGRSSKERRSGSEKGERKLESLSIAYAPRLSDDFQGAELQALFAGFADRAKSFSEEIQELSGQVGEASPRDYARINIYLARTVFSKWSVEILTVLYALRLAGYTEIKNKVGRITSRILSQKLKRLEKAQLIQRSVLSTRPPTVRYSLTDKGLNIARLAEPVFLYAAALEQLYDRPRFLLHEIQNLKSGV